MSAKDKYQVTEWAHPNESIQVMRRSQYLPMRYEQLLQSEIDRWYASNLREAWVEENPEGLIAMFSWRKYMALVEPEAV